MTCGGCEAKVKSSLLMLPNVTEVTVSKEKQSAIITMDKHIPLSVFQNVLDKKYSITAEEHNETATPLSFGEGLGGEAWLGTYKPILLIFGYVLTISIIVATQHNNFDWMKGMNVFMAGFFLTFSFFKMLDLKGFAESYAMYDIVAKKVKAWGFIYAFIELALGIAYATGFQPLLTNIITLTVMSVSIMGVLQAVFNKRTIQCACLGAVFKLPMSTVTIIEDSLMMAMSAGMIFAIFQTTV